MDKKIRNLVAMLDTAHATQHLDEFEGVELVARDMLAEMPITQEVDTVYALCVESIAWLLGGRANYPLIKARLELAAALAVGHATLLQLHMLALWYKAVGETIAMFPPDETPGYTIEGLERSIASFRKVAELAAELDDPFREGLVYALTAELQVWAVEPSLATEFANRSMERLIVARSIDGRPYRDPRVPKCLVAIRTIILSNGHLAPSIYDFRPFLYQAGELVAPP